MWSVNGVPLSDPNWPEAVEQWSTLIKMHATAQGLPPSFVAGVVAGESRGKPQAVSPVGAVGLMQLMPQYFGGNANGRLYDPDTNIAAGTKFLRELWDRYAGNPIKVLAGYNAGSARCRASDSPWGLVQNPGYVSKCLSYANEAKKRGFDLSSSVSKDGATSNVWLSFAAGAFAYAVFDHFFDITVTAINWGARR